MFQLLPYRHRFCRNQLLDIVGRLLFFLCSVSDVPTGRTGFSVLPALFLYFFFPFPFSVLTHFLGQ